MPDDSSDDVCEEMGGEYEEESSSPEESNGFCNASTGYTGYTMPPPSRVFFPPEYTLASKASPCFDNSLPFDAMHSYSLCRHDIHDQWESHCMTKRQECEVNSVRDSLVLVKTLVNEAWRRDRDHLAHKLDYRRACSEGNTFGMNFCPCVSSQPDIGDRSVESLVHELNLKWKRIGRNAVREVMMEGQPYDAIRRLANQFIFLDGKQTETYTAENPCLQMRLQKQRLIINQIERNPEGRLFLHPDGNLMSALRAYDSMLDAF